MSLERLIEVTHEWLNEADIEVPVTMPWPMIATLAVRARVRGDSTLDAVIAEALAQYTGLDDGQR